MKEGWRDGEVVDILVYFLIILLIILESSFQDTFFPH